jgi:hypothetical protein
VDDRQRCHDDGEERRRSDDTDDVGVLFLLTDVGGESEGAAGEDEVDETEEEGREGVVEDEVLESGPLCCRNGVVGEVEGILESSCVGVVLGLERRPWC